MPGEVSSCMSCAAARNRARDAAGLGDLACCDCGDVWSVKFDEDDAALNTDECPGCASSAVEPLSAAQARAQRRAGGWL